MACNVNFQPSWSHDIDQNYIKKIKLIQERKLKLIQIESKNKKNITI